MHQFQWVVVLIGMLIGLGVARILNGMVSMFRSRHDATPNWIPVVWAMTILLLQLECWWCVSDLRDIVKSWNFTSLLAFSISPLIIFFAAALVLPHHELKEEESHQVIFRENGRWALILISAYAFESFVETLFVWQAEIRPVWVIENIMVILFPLWAFSSRGRSLKFLTVSGFIVTVAFVFTDAAIAPNLR